MGRIEDLGLVADKGLEWKAKCAALTAERDQVKERARGCVNARVRRGSIPNPNDLPCMDCGHIGPNRRHEYDHFLGYTGPAKTQVEAVCSKCHRKREAKRNGR